MKIRVHEKEDSKVAIIESTDIIISGILKKVL